MQLAKRTYVLPPDTVNQFEKVVHSGRRSAVVAGLLGEYVTRQKREALRRDIAEGCREMWDVYLDTAREWEATDDELHNAAEH